MLTRHRLVFRVMVIESQKMTEKKAISWTEHKGCDSCLLEDEKTVEQSVRKFSKVLMDSIQLLSGVHFY